MLTRVYIDNFRCFVNFEYRPARKQLIFGSNGAGKSSFMDALLFLRQFVTRGDTFDNVFILAQRTRWLEKPELTCEIEAVLSEGKYVYRAVIEPWGEPVRPRVASETVHLNGKPIFEFIKGEVRLYNDRFEHKVNYDFDWHRSALATILERKDNRKLWVFKAWLSGLYCFRLNPFSMSPRAEREEMYPTVDLSNIAAWYRHLIQADPRHNFTMLDDLQKSLDGFNFLNLESAGENIRLLGAEFVAADSGSKPRKFLFSELSDGQRCLICLYTVLHFVLAKGSTVILDEPDNFVALREIQPWLMAVSDMVEDGKGQVLLISHHPEAINQWAPTGGVEFLRDGAGLVRVVDFQSDSQTSLSPSELVARGWERE